jgi:polysaccharide biosynthesis PFTS motif protein
MFGFKSYLVKKKRAALRNRMRGYRILKDSGKLDLLIKIKEDLTNLALHGIYNHSSSLFFGSGLPLAEKIVKQFVVLRFADLKLNDAILIAIGKGESKINLPLPFEWRIGLEKYGFKANTTWNKILWIAHIMFYYLFGISIGLNTIYAFLSGKSDFRNDNNHQNSVYFNSLTSKNLPQTNPDGESYDIITWYSKWNNGSVPASVYLHSVKKGEKSAVGNVPVLFANSAVTNFIRISQFLKFCLGFLWMNFVAVFDLVRGRYVHALLFSEAIRSFHFRLLDTTQLSADYLFHNTGYLLRPIWTYDAEFRGSRILFYFYSSNVERFKEPHGYGIQPYSWQIMTWPNYLVWDEYQADFIRRAVGSDKNIEVVGPIDFHDSDNDCRDLLGNSVIVFDVQPHRDVQYQSYVVVPEYFIPGVVNKFLEDIHSVASKYNVNMVLKRKRHVGNILHRKYRLLIEKLAQQENFISVDPDTAALRLIKEAKIVISMPFTATALIARKEGKISIYYDPVGIVQKDDRAAHGIEVISGFSELEQWFDNRIKLE